MAITENESENKNFDFAEVGNFDWLTWVIGILCGVLTTLVLVLHYCRLTWLPISAPAHPRSRHRRVAGRCGRAQQGRRR